MGAGLFLTGARRLVTWASLNVLMLARTVAAQVVSEAKMASLA